MISSTQWRTLSARLADFVLEQTTALRTQHERGVGELREQVRVLTEANDLLRGITIGDCVDGLVAINGKDGFPCQHCLTAVQRFVKLNPLATPTNAETGDDQS